MEIVLIWILFTLLFVAIAYLVAARARKKAALRQQTLRESPIGRETLLDLQRRITPVLAVAGHQVRDGGVLFEGALRTDPQSALDELTHAFSGKGFTPLLRQGHDPGRVRIALLPGIEQIAWPPTAVERPNWGLHLLLLLLTLMTTTAMGALHAGVNLINEPHRFVVGLPYSLGLMLILGAHELGHYFTAKRYRIRVTPPYFIPVPIGGMAFQQCIVISVPRWLAFQQCVIISVPQ